jgi:trehalose-phosphatase
MSAPLWDHLEHVGRRVRVARRMSLFLDYDGTLAPIAPHPAQARLPPDAARGLRRLAGLPGVSVAVISGRGLADLRSIVGLDELIYAGNHGLEIAGPGLSLVQGEAVAYSRELRARTERIAAQVAGLPGVWVESKGLTASVHYRQATDDTAAQVERMIAEVCHPEFRVTPGHKVYELRPPVDWHKGTAARWIIAQQDGAGASAQASGREACAWPANAQAPVGGLSIAAGDDATDEDLFRALSDGVTIRVGHSAATAADYHVADHEDLARFLEWLARRQQLESTL